MPAGYCDNETSWSEWQERYGEVEREHLVMGHVTDCDLANRIFMVDTRSLSLDAIAVQTAARDRIRWLSVHLAISQDHMDDECLKVEQRLEADIAAMECEHAAALESARHLAYEAGYLAREQQLSLADGKERDL